MTRFARAKGAAASNERIEEDATPWHIMAQQMRSANGCKTASNRDVEDLDGGLVTTSEEKQHPNSIDKVVPNTIEEDDRSSSDENEYVTNDDTETSNAIQNDENVPNENNDSNTALEPEKGKKKKKRNQNKCLNCKEKGHLKMNCPQLPEERRKELQELLQLKIERKGIGTGRKKNKKRKAADEIENKENVKNHDYKRQKLENKNDTIHNSNKIQRNNDPNSNNSSKEKNKKELKDKTGQVVADGEGLFQGFRVKLEDVKRLKKLQKQLKNDKSVKKEEIDATLKRERRKAERALANYHKMVCFNCRKPGHLLVDCPDTKIKEDTPKKDSNANILCFKCGDTTHTSKECVSKLKGAEAYRFAVCFICKEVGHLAKSCPDNPKGLYPKGGGCKFCGSVEHLKADCTRKAQKDKRQEVSLGTISIRNKQLGIEEMDFPAATTINKIYEKKKKVVSF